MRQLVCIQCGTTEDVCRHSIFNVPLCESEWCHEVAAVQFSSWGGMR